MNDNLDILTDAIVSGDKEAVSHLIDLFGSSLPTQRDSEGRSCLHWCAASKESEKLIPLLLSFGADTSIQCCDCNGWTPLHALSAKGCSYGVACLLHYGVDPNQRNPHSNSTALHLATSHKQVEIVRLLLAFGAKTDLKSVSGETAEDLGLAYLLRAAET
jgi:ankyrin repeat protein